MSRSILVPFVLMITAMTASAEWHDYVIDNYSYSPSIALFDPESPLVVYSRDYPGVKYATFNGTSWSTYTLYDISYGGNAHTDLLIDVDGVPHVSFDPYGYTTYGFMDSTGQWLVETLPTGCHDTWNSLDLGPAGNPCISLYRYSSEDLQFAIIEESTWEIETVDSIGDTGDCNSLVIDDEGVVHIAYCRYYPDPGVLYAMRDESSQWHLEAVDTSMSSEPKGTSLALDPFGNPCISYSAMGELRYASREGSSWEIEAVFGMDTGPAILGTSLAVDQYGHPHIVHSSPNADYLLYSVDQGAGWQTDSIVEIYGVSAGDPDLALDDLGRSHIVYESWDNNRNLHYIYNDEPSGFGAGFHGEGTLSLSAGPVPFQGSVQISCTVPEGEMFTLRIFDISGRLVQELSPGRLSSGQNLFYWQPGVSVPSGQYILVLETAGERTCRKLLYLR